MSEVKVRFKHASYMTYIRRIYETSPELARQNEGSWNLKKGAFHVMGRSQDVQVGIRSGTTGHKKREHPPV